MTSPTAEAMSGVQLARLFMCHNSGIALMGRINCLIVICAANLTDIACGGRGGDLLSIIRPQQVGRSYKSVIINDCIKTNFSLRLLYTFVHACSSHE